MSADHTYLVFGSRPWSRRIFEDRIAKLPGRWHFFTAPQEFSSARLGTLEPRYLFFLHWSWKVPSDLLERYECVGFHMTDLPFGRGGSPLQNLIARGHTDTKITAFRLTDTMDAGPIYLQHQLSLNGTAEEIYVRASETSAIMLAQIIKEEVRPVAQSGEPTVFQRRTPEESRVPALGTLDMLHDHIRMLDAEGYPHAFLDHGDFRVEFRRATRSDNSLVTEATIYRRQDRS